MAALYCIVSHTLASHWSRSAQMSQHWAPIGRGGQANDPRYEWRRHNGNVASHSPILDCRTHSMGRYTDIQPWRTPGSGVQLGQLAPPQLHHQGGEQQACRGGWQRPRPISPLLLSIVTHHNTSRMKRIRTIQKTLKHHLFVVNINV